LDAGLNQTSVFRLDYLIQRGVIHELLKLFIKHRRQFRTLNSDMDALLHLRYAADDVLDEIGPKRLDYYDEEDQIPF
jgi:hypothetical protein